MPRRALILVVLVLTALTAFLALRPDDDSAVRSTRDETTPPPAVSTAGAGPTLVGAPPHPATDVERPPSPWWLEADVESLNPAVRSARLEARWWPAKPSPPYEGAVADYGVDASLVDSKARVRITGDARPGWTVLFVVEDGRPRLAYPWLAEPATEVGAGRGHRVERPVLVGARSLRLRLLDREDLPLAGFDVDVHDPATDLGQVETTDAEGRARFDALGADEVRVSWRPYSSRSAGASSARAQRRWPERSGGAYSGGEARPVRVEESEVVLRVPRRALLRVRGRVEGAPEEAWLPVDMYGLSTIRPGRNVATTASDASHGIWVDPGAYGVGHHSGNVTTPALKADEERTVDLPASVPAGEGWLDVGFDVRALPGDDRVACAVAARRLPESNDWQGRHATAPHDRVLLLLPAGSYEVTGALRTDGNVRCSAPRQVEVRAGEGTSVTLSSAPAGALRLSRPGGGLGRRGGRGRGRDCAVVERAYPLTGVVTDSTFRFGWISWTEEMATWWLPAGSYVLRQWDDDEPGAERRLTFEVRERAVTSLVQDATGWFSYPIR